MNTDTQVIYVPDLARMLGRTESAVRAEVNRGGKNLPPRLDMGRRICWLRATVEAWLKARELPAKGAKK